MYHGEKVAFGTIVQLVLEDAPTEKLEEVLGFCIELGLPVTMKELGVAELTREQAMPRARPRTPCATCRLR